MPLQNRVLPTGALVAIPERGLFTGNRGILHSPDQTLGTSRWTHKHWICCALEHPRGTYHGPMPDRRWTALFFLDEAVALSAGHRPCFECRRTDALRFQATWSRAHGPARAAEIDQALHPARVRRDRSQVRHIAAARDLPDGTFLLLNGGPALIIRRQVHAYAPGGYGPPTPLPPGDVMVLTPAPVVAALAAGYAPKLHGSVET